MVQRMNREEGYTLIEVIITVMLMSLVIAIGGAAYLFAQTHLIDWRRNLGIQNQVHTVTERLSADMYSMTQLEVISDSTFSYEKDDIYTSFFMYKGVAYKDSVQIVGQKKDSLLFLFKEHQTKEKEKVMIEYTTSATNGVQHMRTRNVIGLRTPVLWKPLNQQTTKIGGQ